MIESPSEEDIHPLVSIPCVQKGIDQWARELVELQNRYPKLAKECKYHDTFKDFDGFSGYDLPMNDPYILAKAKQLLAYKVAKERSGSSGQTEQMSLF